MNNGLIKNYIKKVTKDMGSNQRKEVSKELKTHILDSADAIAAEKNVDVDDFIIREVILNMGPAEEVAAMYPVETTFIDTLKELTKLTVKFFVLVISVSLIVAIAQWIYFQKLQYPQNNVINLYNLHINAFTLIVIFVALIIVIAIRLIRKRINQPKN
jgi:hypothetical protein